MTQVGQREATSLQDKREESERLGKQEDGFMQLERIGGCKESRSDVPVMNKAS
jgi:hypothetical protein